MAWTLSETLYGGYAMINYLAVLAKCLKCGKEYVGGAYSKKCPHKSLFKLTTTTDATSWTIIELEKEKTVNTP